MIARLRLDALPKLRWAALLIVCAVSSTATAQQVEPRSVEAAADNLTDTLDYGGVRPAVVFTDAASAPAGSESAVEPAAATDDFDNSAHTAWWIHAGQSAAELANTIATDDARIIDIEVDGFSPYTFTVTYVRNAGAYAKSWWYYYGLTAAQVNSALAHNDARPISLKAYDTGGGQVRFAVVMIANTGADRQTYWWYYGESAAGMSTLLAHNDARLIAFDHYTTEGNIKLTAIMIGNTGKEATSWWWYDEITPNALAAAITMHKARVFYLTGNADGTLNAIMEGCPRGCSEWWYYHGKSGRQIFDRALQNGARLVNLATYPGCGGTCFAGAMINNSNAITTRVGNLLRAGRIGGTEGLYLKEVGGAVLANLEDSVVFEPASTIKVLANLYATDQVQKGSIGGNARIPHYTNGPESCPDPPIVSGTEPLETALREMMFHSDNARTREVTDHFTAASINAYASSIGLLHTSFNEIVGCIGTTPDMLTLDDAAVLYEGVATRSLLDVRYRGVFYGNMAGRAQFESAGYDWTHLWDTDIPNIINEVAPAAYTAARKQAYFNAMNLAYKAGNYVICTNASCTDVVEDISIAGWFKVPVCAATGATRYKEYVFGIMFANEPFSGWTSGTSTPTDDNFTTAKAELLREQIRAGMTSCAGRSL